MQPITMQHTPVHAPVPYPLSVSNGKILAKTKPLSLSKVKTVLKCMFTVATLSAAAPSSGASPARAFAIILLAAPTATAMSVGELDGLKASVSFAAASVFSWRRIFPESARLSSTHFARTAAGTPRRRGYARARPRVTCVSLPPGARSLTRGV